MKPTPIDREAAGLFSAAPGMRACNADGEWGRLAEADWAGAVLFHRWFDSMALHSTHIVAIDANDNPTVGEMLAQVEAAVPRAAVSIFDRRHSLPGHDERRFMVIVARKGTQATATGPTRGAALVAAMRAIKSNTRRE
jgi:hypothetical protein